MKRVATTPKNQNDALHKELPLIHFLARPHDAFLFEQSKLFTRLIVSGQCFDGVFFTATFDAKEEEEEEEEKMKKAKKCLSAPS